MIVPRFPFPFSFYFLLCQLLIFFYLFFLNFVFNYNFIFFSTSCLYYNISLFVLFTTSFGVATYLSSVGLPVEEVQEMRVASSSTGLTGWRITGRVMLAERERIFGYASDAYQHHKARERMAALACRSRRRLPTLHMSEKWGNAERKLASALPTLPRPAPR